MMMMKMMMDNDDDVLGGLFCVAGAARWQPKGQISWHTGASCEYRFRGRRSTFARSGDK